MTDVRFTHTGHCNALGNFVAGDEAHGIDDALAKHLVEDARCAEYSGEAGAGVLLVTKKVAVKKANRSAV